MTKLLTSLRLDLVTLFLGLVQFSILYSEALEHTQRKAEHAVPGPTCPLPTHSAFQASGSAVTLF